jgi:hypothetical protein
MVSCKLRWFRNVLFQKTTDLTKRVHCRGLHFSSRILGCAERITSSLYFHKFSFSQWLVLGLINNRGSTADAATVEWLALCIQDIPVWFWAQKPAVLRVVRVFLVSRQIADYRLLKIHTHMSLLRPSSSLILPYSYCSSLSSLCHPWGQEEDVAEIRGSLVSRN